MPPKSGSKQDVAMKAASKKNAGKESRRKLGYYLAIGVGLGSCVLAGVLALYSGDKVTPSKRASQLASVMKAQKEAAAEGATAKSNEPFTPKGDILKIMEGFDVNKDDKISMDEIRTAAAPKMENFSKERELADQFIGWENAFPKADSDKDGYLSAREVGDLVQKVTMQTIASKMGMGAEEAELKEFKALSFMLWIANPKAEEVEQEKEEPKQNITHAALFAVQSISSSLAEGQEPPSEMSELKQALERGEESVIGSALYRLVVKQALDFDMQDGKMVPTATDFAKQDDAKVHEKLMYAYKYGINMAVKGHFGIDVLTDVVVNKLASRVSMDGPAFESWLGVKGFLKGDDADSDAETKSES